MDAAQPAARQVFIGPANTAGQAGQWAKAIQRNNPGRSAVSMRIEAGLQDFPADWTVKRERYKSSAAWRAETADYLLHNVSHVLFESGRPILGQSSDAWFGNDLPVLDSAGIKHGVIFHGPEVRDPRRHAEVYPHSPFSDREDKATTQLQVAVDLMQAHLKDYAGPRFVATPDLLEFVEGSVWLPAVVDLDDDAPTQPVLERDKPVVLHALSRTALKGTADIDAVLTELHSKGLIEYQRVEGVSHAELTKLVRDADIVVDQLLLGAYSAFAVEAMAAGRVTVGHVAKRLGPAPAGAPHRRGNPGHPGRRHRATRIPARTRPGSSRRRTAVRQGTARRAQVRRGPLDLPAVAGEARADRFEEAEHPGDQEGGRVPVEGRQGRVGEKVLLTGVEEQFCLVGGGDESAGRGQVAVLLGEERVGVHPVHLDGNTLGPGLAELRNRDARVEQQRSPGSRTGLGQLLSRHAAE